MYVDIGPGQVARIVNADAAAKQAKMLLHTVLGTVLDGLEIPDGALFGGKVNSETNQILIIVPGGDDEEAAE